MLYRHADLKKAVIAITTPISGWRLPISRMYSPLDYNGEIWRMLAPSLMTERWMASTTVLSTDLMWTTLKYLLSVSLYFLVASSSSFYNILPILQTVGNGSRQCPKWHRQNAELLRNGISIFNRTTDLIIVHKPMPQTPSLLAKSR